MARGVFDPKVFDPRVFQAGGHEVTIDITDAPDEILVQVITISYGRIHGGPKPKRKEVPKPKPAFASVLVVDEPDTVLCIAESYMPASVAVLLQEEPDHILVVAQEDFETDEMVLEFIAQVYREGRVMV